MIHKIAMLLFLERPAVSPKLNKTNHLLFLHQIIISLKNPFQAKKNKIV
jgi:hypothetical protein